MIVLSIIFVIIILYSISFLLTLLIYKKGFGYRFELNPYIKYYHEKEFDCIRKEATFNIDDIKIKGLFITPNKEYDKKKIIIYAHGMFSSKEAYLQDIGSISAHGFEVFCYDNIGVNESEGKNIGGLSSFLKTLDYAVNFVKKTYPEKDIYVIGHSAGAYATINVLKYHPDIKKICAISPFVNINKILYSMVPAPLKLITFNGKLYEGLIFKKYAFTNAIKTLNEYEGKALILHSKDDKVVPYKKGTYILEKKLKNKNNINFIIVDNKNHQPQYTAKAVKRLNEFSNKINTLSTEDQIKLMENTNFHDLGRLDKEIMNKIIDFFKK